MEELNKLEELHIMSCDYYGFNITFKTYDNILESFFTNEEDIYKILLEITEKIKKSYI